MKIPFFCDFDLVRFSLNTYMNQDQIIINYSLDDLPDLRTGSLLKVFRIKTGHSVVHMYIIYSIFGVWNDSVLQQIATLCELAGV